MLKTLRIGPKLWLAPALVAAVLLLSAGALYRALSGHALPGMPALDAARPHLHILMAAMAALVLLSIVLPLLVTMLVRRALLRDLAAISGVAEALAQGDLSRAAGVAGRDEIAATAHALDQAIVNLGGTLRTVRLSAQAIDTAARAVACDGANLARHSGKQAAALSTAASAMEALTGTLRDDAARARRASDLAASAAHLARHGRDVQARAARSMGSITASSRRLGQITDVVDALSFQANHLEQSAAAMTVRAGDQEPGLALMAAQVRALAQRAAAAASEVKALVASSVASVDSGSASVNDAVSSMGNIVASVQQVTDITERVSAASAEQAERITQANAAMGQMHALALQNAARVQEAAIAAGRLQQQAVTLAATLALFQFEVEREDNTESQPAPLHTERRRRHSPMRGMPARSVARAASLARARARHRPET